MNRKKLIQTSIKIAISAALIFWIVQGVEISEIFEIIGSASLPILLFSFLFKFLGYYISAIRWRILLRAQGADASILFLISSYFVGFFLNNILPSSIGGDVVRIYDSWRAGTNRPTAITVIFIDRFLGSLALLFLIFFTLLIPTQLPSALPISRLGIAISTIGMIGLCWLIFVAPRSLSNLIAKINLPFLQKLNTTFSKVADAFDTFQQQRGALINSLWLSIALQINVVIYHYFIAQSLHLSVPFYSFFITIPVYTLITTLPISINGIGVRENLFIFFFSLFGVPRVESLAYSWLLYAILIIQGLLGGVVYALRRELPIHRKAVQPEAEDIQAAAEKDSY
ncbi:MAG: flippase-like domain-containing protein [Cyanobacteria bacterium CRU_2_1]|nr:flippase-like domain-containing protein [Cyanobacteria bacterium CRU_2_1]